jgi:hypothetical protein
MMLSDVLDPLQAIASRPIPVIRCNKQALLSLSVRNFTTRRDDDLYATSFALGPEETR